MIGIGDPRTGARPRAIGRLENFVEEIGSNLVRERERSRIGDKSIEFHERIDESLNRLRKGSSKTGRKLPASRDRRSSESMRQASADVLGRGVVGHVELRDDGSVRSRAARRRGAAFRRGEEGDTSSARIPQRGAESPPRPRERDRPRSRRYSTTTLSGLAKGDKMLVECSRADGRAMVCIADTGHGLPGDVISRLFMPFVRAGGREERKSSLSLAGNVLRRHSATITVKSSRSWRTILALEIPVCSGPRPAQARKTTGGAAASVGFPPVPASRNGSGSPVGRKVATMRPAGVRRPPETAGSLFHNRKVKHRYTDLWAGRWIPSLQPPGTTLAPRVFWTAAGHSRARAAPGTGHRAARRASGIAPRAGQGSEQF